MLIINFFIDMGTTQVICDLSLTTKLGDFVGRVATRVENTGREIRTYQNPGIGFPNWKFPNQPVGVVDCELFRWASGLDVRGFVGVEALNGLVVIMDYDNKSLTISTDDKPLLNEHWSSVSIHANQQREPTASVEIEGIKVDLLLDTGSDTTISLDEDTYSKLEKAGVIVTNGRSAEVLSGAGIAKARSGTFVGGKLFDRKLKGIDVTEGEGASSLGMGLLTCFDSAVDLKNLKFYYKVRKGEPPIFMSRMLGAIMSYDAKGATVQRLKPGGGAFEDAGIHVGDHIDRVDSLQGSDLNLVSLYELTRDSANKTISVRVDRGSQGGSTKLIKLGERQYLVPKDE